MATTMYLREVAPPLWASTSVASGAAGAVLTMHDAARGVTPGAELFEGTQGNITGPGGVGLRALSTTIGANPVSAGRGTVLGPTAGLFLGAATTPLAFLSPPLAADITISATVSFAMCASENNMSANVTLRMAVYRVDEQGALTLIINSLLGTELGTTQARSSWSGSPTSTNMKVGDRILLLPMIDDATATTMAATLAASFFYDGTNAALYDSNVQFTENLTFLTTDPTGTTYYLRDTASDVASSKVLSTVQGSGTVDATHTTTAGAIAFPGHQWTATAGGSAIQWFTPTLNAFTLSGAVLASVTNNATVLELATTPFDSLIVELAVCDAAGANPVVWSRSYTSSLDAASPKTHYLTGPSTSVTQGQRLRLRFFSDDMRPSGNVVAGTNRVIRYDGTSTYASALTFTQTITDTSSNTASGEIDPLGFLGIFGL